jgi:hypothetical protein
MMTQKPTGGRYDNFEVAIYTRVHEIQLMRDIAWLEERWDRISAQLKVDKFYIEIQRDRVVPEPEHIETLKRFFAERGVRTAAGLALTVDEPNRFETPCYTDPKDREFVKSVVELSARHFDEIILDDFFFTNTKSDSDIAAKGDRTWNDFRLELMREAAQSLVLEPARAVNPNVKVVIKYPNWYEHFHGCGFDLELQPSMFDAIYTGTETRHFEYNAQHLQEYEGYAIMRYFENIAPGRNGGGWVDTGGLRSLDRFAEQIWLTLFAKAQEITLFDFRQMLYPVKESLRGAWQATGTSFDFDAMVEPFRKPDGSLSDSLTMARSAAVALEQADAFLGKLGDPTGIASHRPAHATGEEFLHNYIGAIGIPMDIRPRFPADEPAIFLTEAAKHDLDVVAKIEAHLRAGNRVTVTSGLVATLQDRGLSGIVDWRVTGKKVLTDEFYRWGAVFKSDRPILLPQIEYITNDSWELVGANANGHPLVLEASYSKGTLVALAVPDDHADLYRLPSEVLSIVRESIMKPHFVRIEGPSRIALITYDNDTLIVESFRDEEAGISLILDGRFSALRDLITGELIAGESREVPIHRWGKTETQHIYPITLKAHSYRVFAAEA